MTSPATGAKPSFELDAATFERLLEFLAPEATTASARADAYEVHREKLVAFFRWRHLADPASLADETLDRVARKVAAGEVRPGSPGAFVLGVARLLALEAGRRDRKETHLDVAAQPAAVDDTKVREAHLRALEVCLERLREGEREVLLAYHRHGGRSRIDGRREMAEELGVSMTALRLRVFRVRERVERCVRRRLEGEE